MLGVNTIEIFSKNLHENRVKFPEERNAFVLDYQHGHHDIMCKLAIFHYHWDKENHSLNQGLRHLKVCYIEVPL